LSAPGEHQRVRTRRGRRRYTFAGCTSFGNLHNQHIVQIPSLRRIRSAGGSVSGSKSLPAIVSKASM
jgi:hypothetical protein